MEMLEFVKQIARCAVCGDSGAITFGRDMQVDLTERGHGQRKQVVTKGTTASCPRCGDSEDPTRRGTGDPDYVAWHCTQGDSAMQCQRDLEGENGRREPHIDCGYRVMLPLDLTIERNGSAK